MNYLDKPLFIVLERIENYQGCLNYLSSDLLNYKNHLIDKLDPKYKFQKGQGFLLAILMEKLIMVGK